jgi:hypothetical protein
VRRRRRAGPVERNDDGTFSLFLEEHERDALRSFAAQLRELVAGDTRDARVTRLFPVAYNDDAEADAEYQRFMRDELVTARLATIDQVDEMLSADGPLTGADITRLMLTVNSLRLVLGTLLDVTEDDTEPEWDDDDPVAAQWQLYAWLGWLLEWIVEAQSAGGNP